MKYILQTAILSIPIISMFLGCTSDLTSGKHILDKESLFWKLELNHGAANLATLAPYATLTLTMTGYTSDGNEIHRLTNTTIRSLSDDVLVFPDGIIKAVRQTTTSGIVIIARATFNGVTLEDTARIVVTSTPLPPVFKEIHPRLNNNERYVFRAHLFDILQKSIVTDITDTSGTAIPRAIVKYKPRSNINLQFENPWKGDFEALGIGEHIVDIDGYIYGKKVSDSIAIKIVDRRVQVHAVNSASGVPRESHISAGGGVYWLNHTDDSLDIEFEYPNMASRSCCTLIGEFLGSDSGNIRPFQRDMTKPIFAEPCLICFHRVEPDVAQGRSFHMPGRYKYRSRRNPNVWGTIIVSDPNS